MRLSLFLPAFLLASVPLSTPFGLAAALEIAPAASASAKASASGASSAASSSTGKDVATAQAIAGVFQEVDAARIKNNVVRVNVTAQAYDFSRPWSKRAPSARRGIGAALEGNRVLVTAECVANANYIELESPDGNRKQPATVECVDYEANLALLKPDSANFLEGSGLRIETSHIGDALSVLQLEANGQVQSSTGKVTTAEVTRYPIDDSSFLVCRLSVPLQMRDSMLSLPVLKGGNLAGLMLRYDAQSSLLDFIPSSVIEHFLKDAKNTPYKGFPRMGCSFSPTRDPQLRRYLGLDGNNGGVLISQILRGGPAENAGLHKGDVLLEIEGNPIDSDGNYKDADYGRISLSHLVSGKHFEGQNAKVKIWREGKKLDFEVPVAKRKAHQYLSEPYVIDRAPSYFVLGGLVLQELSRQYLKEFGTDWSRKAPLDLVQLDRVQSELPEEGVKRAVVLTRVLPSDVTIGYEELRNLQVISINGMRLTSLADVPKAMEKAVDGVHRIELKGDPNTIFLDAQAAEASGRLLQRAYGLPALSRIE
jgi:S1-C subfamily serine protease